MKKCSKCNKEKDESNFWKRNNRRSGVSSECKDCASVRRKSNYLENVEEFRERRKSYYYLNREKLCKAQIESQKGNVRYRKYQNQYLIQKKKEGNKKFIARCILSMALKAEMIMKPEKCSKCESTIKIEGHHEDYNKPLDVVWVCYECHKEIHRKERENANS